MTEGIRIADNWELLGGAKCQRLDGCKIARMRKRETSKCRGGLLLPIIASLANHQTFSAEMPCGGTAVTRSSRVDHADISEPYFFTEMVVTNARPK